MSPNVARTIDEDATPPFRGSAVGDISGPAKTSGKALYVGDLAFDGLLEIGVVRSTEPHAQVVSIDLSRALKVEGVVAAVTADDFGSVTYLGMGGSLSDRPPLARDTVRYVGEEIAALAVTSRQALELALPLVRVRYRRRKPVLSAAEAMSDDAPRLHPASQNGNVLRTSVLTRGSMEQPAPGTVTFSAHYESGSQVHAALETHTIVAFWPQEDGPIDIWAPSQGPIAIRREIAHLFGITEDRVRMHDVAIGGDFGSHVKISTSEAVAVALARKTRRPVRIRLSREEEFAATKRRYPFDVDLELGARPDGMLTHLAAEVVCDMGAYHHVGAGDFGFYPQSLTSLYAIENLAISCVGVYTNNMPPGSFRGAGAPQSAFVRECALDELASRLGIDPVDIRLRNLARPQDPRTGWRMDNDRLRECLLTARDRIGWRQPYDVDGRRRGFGIALAAHVTGVGELKAEAYVDLHADGRIVVRSSSADPGTGHRTIIAQVAAHELGVDVARIEVVLGEPQNAPYDPGLGASKGSYVSTNAVGAAARDLKARLMTAAIARFGVNEVEFADGTVRTSRGDARFEQLVEDAAVAGADLLRGHGSFKAGRALDDPDSSDGYSYVAQAVEVEVDEGTGCVRVLRVVSVHDSGTVLNPIMARGQVEGGIVMGIGAALGEELVRTDGRMANTGFADYFLQRASEVPQIDVVLLASDVGPGRYASRGIAEACLAPTSAAIANAVAAATGIRVHSLPITPDRILAAREAEARRLIRPLRSRPDRWWIELVRRLYRRGLHALLHRRASRVPATAGIRSGVSVERPKALPEALRRLQSPGARPMGGGSELLLLHRQGLAGDTDSWVDLRAAGELGSISRASVGLEIGGAVTLSELIQSELVPARTALAQTALEIASRQIRNTATIGGNLCQTKRCWYYRHGFNCYKRAGPLAPCYAIEGDHRQFHAALGGHRCQAVTPSDMATTLTALDGEALVRSSTGNRTVDMEALYVGPGETSLGEGEIIAALRVPTVALERATAFRKMAMYGGGFAMVSAAASVSLDGQGGIADIRVVIGGIAPVPLRAAKVEQSLLNAKPTSETVRAASLLWIADAHPLRNNAWKLTAAAALVARAIGDAVAVYRGEAVR